MLVTSYWSHRLQLCLQQLRMHSYLGTVSLPLQSYLTSRSPLAYQPLLEASMCLQMLFWLHGNRYFWYCDRERLETYLVLDLEEQASIPVFCHQRSCYATQDFFSLYLADERRENETDLDGKKLYFASTLVQKMGIECRKRVKIHNVHSYNNFN